MRTLKSTTTASTTSTVEIMSGTASAPEATAAMQSSPWHSPIPYLFGGLAAMLGLIAFALLILTCSYWRSVQMNGENNENEDDGEKKRGDGKGKERVVYEEQFVVIMAGDDMPTCLAMPVCNKSAKLFSNGSDGCNNGSDDGKAGDQSVKIDLEEEVKHEGSDQSHELHSLHHHDQTEPESSS